MKKRRPVEGEFAPYFGGYINQVPEDDALAVLVAAKNETVRFLGKIPPEKWGFRYEEGKWSVREVVLHLIDTERILLYRALRASRGDKTSLPGFDQDIFVENCAAAGRTPDSLIAEYLTVRMATIFFFKNLTDEQAVCKGTASGATFTAHATAFVIAGHERHHWAVLRERYL